MNHKRDKMRRAVKIPVLIGFAIASAVLTAGVSRVVAQSAPAASPAAAKLDIVDGTTASYRVQEQLAGINFPNDAVGTTSSVTGTIFLSPSGVVDSSQSKLTIDLRTLK